MGEDKVKKIREWSTLTSASEVRSYRLTSFYHRFVGDFSSIVALLNELIENNIKFIWTEKQKTPFIFLKDKLYCTPILLLLDFNKKF